MSGRRRALTTDNVKAKTRKAAAAPKGRRAASADDVKKEKKSDAASSDTVKVVVRMRPFNTKEKNEKRGPCIELDIDANQVVIYDMENKAPKPTNFTFDSVYGENTIQQDFYDKSCRPLVASVLQGFNGTIFAYGQTGCGKTWTMQGVLDKPELRGVIPNSFDHIFERVAENPAAKYLVRGSYLEIYNEEVRDLLGSDPKAKLQLKEHPDTGVYVQGLLEEVVYDVDAMNTVMARGEKNRTVGATLMNAGSSRSHSIFTVVVEEFGEGADGKDHLRAGKLNLVDLAGSETTKKTGATGDRMKEGVNINKSLSALGNVISALVDGKGKHIPYRDSKLTRLLQSSLGGNTKTLMVAAISPADYNYNETLSTLRYANRAKNIKNKAKVNEDPKDAMLREYKEEIERLKQLLAEAGSGNDGKDGNGTSLDDDSEAVNNEDKLDQKNNAEDAREAAEQAARANAESLSADSVAKRNILYKADDAVVEFLNALGLDGAIFATRFAEKGITTMEILRKPWISEGFLVEKLGMTLLEATRFKTAVDDREREQNMSAADREKLKLERLRVEKELAKKELQSGATDNDKYNLDDVLDGKIDSEEEDEGFLTDGSLADIGDTVMFQGPRRKLLVGHIVAVDKTTDKTATLVIETAKGQMRASVEDVKQVIKATTQSEKGQEKVQQTSSSTSREEYANSEATAEAEFAALRAKLDASPDSFSTVDGGEQSGNERTDFDHHRRLAGESSDTGGRRPPTKDEIEGTPTEESKVTMDEAMKALQEVLHGSSRKSVSEDEKSVKEPPPDTTSSIQYRADGVTPLTEAEKLQRLVEHAKRLTEMHEQKQLALEQQEQEHLREKELFQKEKEELREHHARGSDFRRSPLEPEGPIEDLRESMTEISKDADDTSSRHGGRFRRLLAGRNDEEGDNEERARSESSHRGRSMGRFEETEEGMKSRHRGRSLNRFTAEGEDDEGEESQFHDEEGRGNGKHSTSMSPPKAQSGKGKGGKGRNAPKPRGRRGQSRDSVSSAGDEVNDDDDEGSSNRSTPARVRTGKGGKGREGPPKPRGRRGQSRDDVTSQADSEDAASEFGGESEYSVVVQNREGSRIKTTMARASDSAINKISIATDADFDNPYFYEYTGSEVPPPKLVNSNACSICRTGLNRRSRRHCRACGLSCCEACSSGPKLPLPEFSLRSPVRVCDGCGEERLQRAKAWRSEHRVELARRRAEANMRAQDAHEESLSKRKGKGSKKSRMQNDEEDEGANDIDNTGTDDKREGPKADWQVDECLQAAEDGDAEAQFNLGLMYAEGVGIPQSDMKAFEWYLKAAEQGAAPAQYNLGVMYAEGVGIPQSDTEAVEWYSKAAEARHPGAMYNLAIMFEHGNGVEQDTKKAAEWYRKAAKRGYADAQYNLGVMHVNGDGVPKNLPEAVKWLRKAEAQGDKNAKLAIKHVLQLLQESKKGGKDEDKHANEEQHKSMLQHQQDEGKNEEQFGIDLRAGNSSESMKSLEEQEAALLSELQRLDESSNLPSPLRSAATALASARQRRIEEVQEEGRQQQPVESDSNANMRRPWSPMRPHKNPSGPPGSFTSCLHLVDTLTHELTTFDKILFEQRGLVVSASSSSIEGDDVGTGNAAVIHMNRSKKAELEEKLRAVNKNLKSASRGSSKKALTAEAGKLQKELSEIDRKLSKLQQAISLDSRSAAAAAATAKANGSDGLPPIWERGVSLALLQKFACEVVRRDMSARDLITDIKKRLEENGSPVALVRLLENIVCTVSDSDGVSAGQHKVDTKGEYSSNVFKEELSAEVKTDTDSWYEDRDRGMVAGLGHRATGAPSLYLSHSWDAPFADTVGTASAWAQRNAMDPLSTYIWLDYWCCNQWSEVPGAPGLGGTEESIIQSTVFAIRACGNMALSASPGWETPQTLRRLWCAAEVYLAVRLGTQCTLILPDLSVPVSQKQFTLQTSAEDARGAYSIRMEDGEISTDGHDERPSLDIRDNDTDEGNNGTEIEFVAVRDYREAQKESSAMIMMFEDLMVAELPKLIDDVVGGFDILAAGGEYCQTSFQRDAVWLSRLLQQGRPEWGLDPAHHDMTIVNRAVAAALRSFLASTAREILQNRGLLDDGDGVTTKAVGIVKPRGVAPGRDRALFDTAKSLETKDEQGHLYSGDSAESSCVDLMRGYAMILEDQGRVMKRGGGRAWCFKLAVMWHLRVLRILEGSPHLRSKRTVAPNADGTTTTYLVAEGANTRASMARTLLSLALLLKMQGKHGDSLSKFERLLALLTERLAFDSCCGPAGIEVLTACRCDKAVVLREMGRLEESFAEYQQAGQKLIDAQAKEARRRNRRKSLLARIADHVTTTVNTVSKNVFNPYATLGEGASSPESAVEELATENLLQGQFRAFRGEAAHDTAARYELLRVAHRILGLTSSSTAILHGDDVSARPKNITSIGPNQSADAGLPFECLRGMATVRLLQGRHDLAVALFQEALELQESILGDGHIATARTFLCIEAIRKRLAVVPMPPKSKSIARKDAPVISEHEGRDESTSGKSTIEMDELQIARQVAVKQLERTLGVYEIVFGPAHPHTVSVVLQLASAHQKVSNMHNLGTNRNKSAHFDEFQPEEDAAANSYSSGNISKASKSKSGVFNGSMAELDAAAKSDMAAKQHQHMRATAAKNALRCYGRALSEYARDEALLAEEDEARRYGAAVLTDSTAGAVVENATRMAMEAERISAVSPSAVSGPGMGIVGASLGLSFDSMAERTGSHVAESRDIPQQRHSLTRKVVRRDVNGVVGPGWGGSATSSSKDGWGVVTSAANSFGGADLGGCRDVGGQYSPLDTAACVNNMAVEFRKLGMLNEAAQSFARAMQIKERELGAHHPSTAKVLNNYALVRWRMGHLETALSLFQRLLSLYEFLQRAAEKVLEASMSGNGKEERSATIEAAAGVFGRLGDGDIGKRRFHGNIMLHGDDIDEDYEDDDDARSILSSMLNETFGHGNSTGTPRSDRIAADALMTSREILRYGVSKEDIAMVHSNIALILQQQNQTQRAIESFTLCLELREAHTEALKAKAVSALALANPTSRLGKVKQMKMGIRRAGDSSTNNAFDHKAARAERAAEASLASLSSTLYNRGLLYQQTGNLLGAGCDLRRGLGISRDCKLLGLHHPYTSDAAGALAFIARVLSSAIKEGLLELQRGRQPGAAYAVGASSIAQAGKDVNRLSQDRESFMLGVRGGQSIVTRVGGGGSVGGVSHGLALTSRRDHEFAAAHLDANKDECLACFDALCVHWRAVKGRGHPAAVAALNSIAEVHKWEGRKEDAAACFTRALREGNARIQAQAKQAKAPGGGIVGSSGGEGNRKSILGSFVMNNKSFSQPVPDVNKADGGLPADEPNMRMLSGAALAVDAYGGLSEGAVAAAAKADEMIARISSLREEKQAAVSAEDYASAGKIKREILDLQLRIIELEEEARVGGGGLSGEGEHLRMDDQSTSKAGDNSGKTMGEKGQNSSKKKNLPRLTGKGPYTKKELEEYERAKAALQAEQETEQNWGSSQRLAAETRLDALVVTGWLTPEEDEAALRARLETLRGLAASMFQRKRLEEAAAYLARVLRLTQLAVQAHASAAAKGINEGDDAGSHWTRQSLIEPLVALAGAAFSLSHYQQSRALYEQALQVTEKEVGPNSPDTAAALNDLAIVVRELDQNDEALQLHARAIRLRHKTMGVWNPMVAETLFNVSLIYRDEKDLTSAMQVCRGCCRVYAETLGSTHEETADAEAYLTELSNLINGNDPGSSSTDAGNGSESGSSGGIGSIWSCLGSKSQNSRLRDRSGEYHDISASTGSESNAGTITRAPAQYHKPRGVLKFSGGDNLEDDPNLLAAATGIEALKENQNLRPAFRSVLEEIALGLPRYVAGNGQQWPQNASEEMTMNNRPTFRRSESGTGNFVSGAYQQPHQHHAFFAPVSSLSEGLARSKDDEVRLWTASTAAGHFQREDVDMNEGQRRQSTEYESRDEVLPSEHNYRVPKGWDDQMIKNRVNPKTGKSFFDASNDQQSRAPNESIRNKWKVAAARTEITPNLAGR